MKRTPYLIFLILLWFALVALACNLGSNPTPPTVVPKATDTPQPTIGYATIDPNQMPPTQVAMVNPSVNASLTALLNQVAADRLMIHVDALQRLGTRHVNSPDTGSTGVAAAYRYIRSQFEEIAVQSAGKFTAVPQTFTLDWEGVTTTQVNLIGYLGGREVGGGVIVVGAHYDSISVDRSDPNYPAPGANDDGSGIAALIELARIMSLRPVKPRATVMFVAFAAEEIGRKGSIEFLKFLDETGRRNSGEPIHVDAMLNMDIIGSSTGPLGNINNDTMRIFSAGPNDSPSRQLARAVTWINQNLNRNTGYVLQDAGDREGRYSDHLSFSDVGYPAVRFVEALEDRARQHTPEDVIDDVQADYLARNTQAILTVLLALSDGPPPPNPDNIVLRQIGNPTRELIWEPAPGAAGYLIGLRYPGSLRTDETFPWPTNSVEWDSFCLFESLVVASVDASGLIGRPSSEFKVPCAP